MLILCKSSQVRQGGYRWRLPLPWGWEIRWQRYGCYIIVGSDDDRRHFRYGYRPW